MKDGKESDTAPWSTFVAVCETCHQVLLYDNPGDQLEENVFTSGDLVYPKAGKLGSSVPQFVREIYEEAWRIKGLAPNAYAVQIRRALEAICEDRNAKKGNLQTRLSDLASKGDIPKTLVEAGDILRLIGNVGAHAKADSVHPLVAFAIDDFFRAIVEYVYVAPSRIGSFKEKWERYFK
jgi:hypothetical protein